MVAVHTVRADLENCLYTGDLYQKIASSLNNLPAMRYITWRGFTPLDLA